MCSRSDVSMLAAPNTDQPTLHPLLNAKSAASRLAAGADLVPCGG
jgi:hypothetical protein